MTVFLLGPQSAESQTPGGNLESCKLAEVRWNSRGLSNQWNGRTSTQVAFGFPGNNFKFSLMATKSWIIIEVINQNSFCICFVI